MADRSHLLQDEDPYDRIEEQFNESLDASLDPRGPDMLYDLVADLGLPAGAAALDIGCGRGEHAIELARRFRLNVSGVDLALRRIDIATRRLAEEALSSPSSAEAVRFELGSAEDLPAADASADLIWCRDVLCLVADLNAAYREFRRVLKPGGRALVYQMFATDRLEPREAESFLPWGFVIADNMRPEHTEAAIRAAGLQIDKCIVLGPEWGEYGQERTGYASRKLLHAARLLRDPDRYIQQYGQENYDIKLGDCLWHVYRLIGKLSGRVYVLSVQGQA